MARQASGPPHRGARPRLRQMSVPSQAGAPRPRDTADAIQDCVAVRGIEDDAGAGPVAVSIHARVRAGDHYAMACWPRAQRFNPRPRASGRHGQSCEARPQAAVSIHARVRAGDRGPLYFLLGAGRVSIHARVRAGD